MWRWLTNWRVLATSIGVATMLAVALWPDSIEVDVTEARRGSLQITIDEEGQTRVRERFLVSAPVAGRLQRIALEPGDPVTRGRTTLATRIAAMDEGVERAHASIQAYFRGRGWLALGLGVLLTAAAHANKLLAGYVVLKMLGIPAPFLEVLLLQTLITFLLYFAPTPGGSGLAELISAAVMSIYVPRVLTPSYILLWRVTVSYLTVAFGSAVFWGWLRAAEDRRDGLPSA